MIELAGHFFLRKKGAQQQRGAANESMKLICFLFFFGWIKGCPQPLLRTKKKTKRKQID
jgi:hypothetical protein